MQNRPWLKFYGEVPASLDYPDCSMTEFVERTVDKHPAYIAYSFLGHNVSYSQFIAQVYSCARALKALGLGTEDRVLIALPNLPQAVVSFYAVNLIGAVAVMIHPLSSEGELKHFIEAANPSLIICLDQFHDKFLALANRLKLPPIVVTGAGDAIFGIKHIFYRLTEGRKIKTPPYNDGLIPWRNFIDAGNNYKGVYRLKKSANDPAVILFSGGTTGLTKGVLLSNLNFNALALQTGAMGNNISPGSSMLSVMPVFHGFGLGVCIHTVLVFGCRCILVPRFNVKSYAGLLKREKPNYIAGVPTLFEALLRGDSLRNADLSCLKGVFSGGDSLSVELKRRFDRFLSEHGASVPVREGYGTTECVTASCLTPYNIEREGSIGLPFPDTLYKITKTGSTELSPFGELGEICISGPTVMLGYLDNESDSVLKLHDDGRTWLHTGDLGFMDTDGFVYFRQRIKRIIVSSGYSIYPSQLENVLSEHEAVKLCCVIGIPHPLKMQVPKAFITLNEGFTDSPHLRDSIERHCRENIAKFALPRELEIRSELPTTLVGKVAYKQLEEEELARINTK